MSDTEYPVIDVVGVEKDGLYSSEARYRLQRADAVLGWQRHLEALEGDENVKTREITELEECIPAFDEFSSEDRVVLLASGDPLFYGIGAYLRDRVPKKNLRFVPARSSIQMAFSSLREPYNDAEVLSLHGRSIDDLRTALTQSPSRLAIFTEPDGNTPEVIYEFLEYVGCKKYDFYLCESLSDTDNDPIKINDTSDFPDRVDPLNIVVLLRDPEAREMSYPNPGIADEVFQAPDDTMVSKQELRLLDIGLLDISGDEIVWDIGAATGSVSIESARLNPDARYYALEKRQDRYDNLVDNLKHFETFNVIPVHGVASKTLSDLPKPDRVFLGGSGGELTDILSLVTNRLNEDGKIVANFITLENFERTRKILDEQEYQVRSRQITMHESGSLAHYTRWEDGPVLYVIEAESIDGK